MRILVAEPLAEEGLAILRPHHDVDVRTGLSRADLLAALPDYDALLVRSGVKVDAEAIAAGRKLQVIGRAGVGVDNIELEPATAAGIVVVNAPTGNTIAAAEHTVALLLALARRIPAADASLRRGEWKRSSFTGRELRGKTLGVIGLGKIGMAVADRARGFEMSILGHDPFVTEEAAARRGIRLASVEEILRTCDAVTVHVPLTAKTKGLIGAAELRTMKPEAFLVNVARGGVIDEAALADALAAGTIAGAAVDVFSEEPLPAENPLRGAPNTILTPHLGASTEEAQTRVAVETAEQVLDVLAGRSARYAVNAPLVSPETAQAVAPYLPLARLLGRFYAQYAPDLTGLTLEVAGELAAHDTTALVAATLGGLLADTEERVNVVNAAQVARARGISIAERKVADAGRHASLLTLRGSALIAGTVAAGEPRLVRLGDYWLDLAPAPMVLVTHHSDRPGTVGRIGLLLGEADINISSLTLARGEPRADAYMVLTLDDVPGPEVLARIGQMDAVMELWAIRLEDAPAR